MKRQLPKRHDLAPLLQFKKPTLSPEAAAARVRADDRGPAPDRQAAYAEGGVRLHRRRRGRRGLAGPRPAGVRRRGVPPGDPARRVHGGHLAGGAGRAGRAAVRDRADRVHPDDAGRGRDRRAPRPRARPGSRSRCPRWAPRRSRTSRRPTRDRVAATGSSCTCGRTATARWRWSTGPRRPGYDTLLVTVDVPVAGARLRDVRNGMTIPPTLTPRTVVNAIPRPAWWFNFLTTEPLAFASPGRVVRARSPTCWTRCSTRP